MKLKHDSASKSLWDALVDFPASVILQRSALVRSLFDILGEHHTQKEIGILTYILFDSFKSPLFH